jgi:hypothetical protein
LADGGLPHRGRSGVEHELGRHVGGQPGRLRKFLVELARPQPA